MTIELEVIQQGKAVMVLVPSWRVKASIEALKKQAATITDQKQRAEMTKNAEDIEAYQREIREKFADRIEVRKYEFAPYTYGGKLNARRTATTWENGQSRFDEDVYVTEIVALGISKPTAEVLEMSPTIVRALYSEVSERSEPDPSKLDFLPS